MARQAPDQLHCDAGPDRNGRGRQAGLTLSGGVLLAARTDDGGWCARLEIQLASVKCVHGRQVLSAHSETRRVGGVPTRLVARTIRQIVRRFLTIAGARLFHAHAGIQQAISRGWHMHAIC